MMVDAVRRAAPLGARRYAPLLAALLWWLLGLSALAQAETKTVLLSEEGAWPPYTYEAEGTPTKGLSLDLMREIFSRIRTPFDLKLFPMNRCVIQMKSGERDAITMISKNQEREQFLDFSEPLVESSGYVYYDGNRRQAIHWKKFSDLAAFEIGTVMGHNYGEAFLKAKEQDHLRINEVVRIEQNFKKLFAGRIDVMFANQAEVSEFLRNNPGYLGRLKAADKPYLSYTYHMGFSKASAARQIIPAVNQAIAEMKADGTTAKILARHLY